jgi:uncharacterized protein (DUF362 family)
MPFPGTGPYLLGPPVVSAVGCESYDWSDVQPAVQRCCELAGGIDDVIAPGDRVGIKVNLTSGRAESDVQGITIGANLVKALIEEIQKIPGVWIWILEGQYGTAFQTHGYEQVAADTGATLVDTNLTSPHRIKTS